MFFVIPPVFKCAAVYWLANLFGTRRLHWSLGLMKLQARLLERQIAVVQNSSDLGFGVRYDVFVLNAQYFAGQDPIPMVHQFNIVTIISTDIGEPISKGLPTGEVLCIAAETGRHRLPARIDDLCIGNNHVDQPDMQKIIGHLVDKKRRRPPVNFTSVYVLLPQIAELSGTQISQDFRVARYLGFLFLTA